MHSFLKTFLKGYIAATRTFDATDCKFRITCFNCIDPHGVLYRQFHRKKRFRGRTKNLGTYEINRRLKFDKWSLARILHWAQKGRPVIIFRLNLDNYLIF